MIRRSATEMYQANRQYKAAPTDDAGNRHVTVSVPVQHAGAILAPTESTCRAFAIHPDRSVVLVDAAGRVQILWPKTDRLYDIGALGADDLAMN